ncbi:hypothetical protein TUM15746_11370 [Neisseria gonorrhoeae]|nr:hypothetical protein TUM15746_11370 [Neisseria gonorrhoeae]GFL02382.1 hypothetical protein TUM15747_00970 [Neisseria gonorrhoeae]GFL13322.1 hypothetical protein TUM15752_07330 [Neisseria gonorrhoeae]GFL27467.1 hypothetical protein TUM15759_06860 [Neisseria gonorrhoeae]GFL40069.1 hypothetical protein TUM15765_10160 [Neisseria gonorrhoeae]
MFAVAGFGADFKQWLAGRVFAYQIDGGRRLARAVRQPRHAAHDFHALIGGGVGIARIGQRVGNGDAVDLVVGDAAAAREQVVVARAVGAGLVPVACNRARSSVLMFWSRICCDVMTLTLCGISRRVMGSPNGVCVPETV